MLGGVARRRLPDLAGRPHKGGSRWPRSKSCSLHFSRGGREGGRPRRGRPTRSHEGGWWSMAQPGAWRGGRELRIRPPPSWPGGARLPGGGRELRIRPPCARSRSRSRSVPWTATVRAPCRGAAGTDSPPPCLDRHNTETAALGFAFALAVGEAKFVVPHSSPVRDANNEMGAVNGYSLLETV